VNEEEFLAAMKQPLRGLARRLTSDAQRHEELCQEGWIAVWKAWKKKPDATFSFYYQAADWRMRGILTGLRALEGQPARSAAHPPEQLVSELPEYASLEDEFTRVVEEIDRLYHEGALVREALSVLTPRQLEFVTLRYFEERTLPEIRERLGYPPGDKKVLNIWHDRNGARDRLREQLGGQK